MIGLPFATYPCPHHDQLLQHCYNDDFDHAIFPVLRLTAGSVSRSVGRERSVVELVGELG